jgi:transcriptional regulator with XRE-family HTH domain
MDTQDRFAERVTRLRKARGLTQTDMADALNVSHQAVSKWERGESLPDVALLVPLAALLDTTVDALLRGAEQGEEETVASAEPSPSVTPAPWRWGDTLFRWRDRGETPQEDAPAPPAPPAMALAPVPPVGPAALDVPESPMPKEDPPDVRDLADLAPFVSRTQMARLLDAAGGQVGWDLAVRFGPFLEQGELARLLERVAEPPPADAVTQLAPFLPATVLEAWVAQVPGDQWSWASVKQLAPFVGHVCMAELLGLLEAKAHAPQAGRGRSHGD